MSYADYENLDIDKAIAKLRSKSFHDDEDKAFARARSEYLSAEELAAITGDELVEAPKVEGDKAPAAGSDENLNPAAPAVAGVVLVNDKDFKLDALQGIAAESELDTSGTKKDLVERINAFRTANAAKVGENTVA